MAGIAKVIVNPRTGSVVMNQKVTIDAAVAHGALSVVVTSDQQVSQPNALSGGQTVTTAQTDIAINQSGGALMQLKAGANLGRRGQGDQCLGFNPQDLVVHPAGDESRRCPACRSGDHLVGSIIA